MYLVFNINNSYFDDKAAGIIENRFIKVDCADCATQVFPQVVCASLL